MDCKWSVRSREEHIQEEDTGVEYSKEVDDNTGSLPRTPVKGRGFADVLYPWRSNACRDSSCFSTRSSASLCLSTFCAWRSA